MRDPVITPSGVTYDRKDIDEHLQVCCDFSATRAVLFPLTLANYRFLHVMQRTVLLSEFCPSPCLSVRQMHVQGGPKNRTVF